MAKEEGREKETKDLETEPRKGTEQTQAQRETGTEAGVRD